MAGLARSLFALWLALASLPAWADTAPAILLAEVYAADVDVDVSQYWVSEKFDGVRAQWDGRSLRFRGGGRVPAPAWFTANFPAAPLDGELWIARDRFDALLKLKPWQDAEAVVAGYTPGTSKYQGMTGALVMEMPDGKRFHIGSGLTDALRRVPPPIGARITYRYQHLTKKGVPRFPRYLRVREDFY